MTDLTTSTAKGCLIFEIELKFLRNGRNLTAEEFLDAFVSEVARRISIQITPVVERWSSKADQTVRGETEGQTGIRRLALGIHEAADLLGVSSYTLRRNIERGQIHAIRVGRRLLIPTKELERVLADKSAPSGASSSQSL